MSKEWKDVVLMLAGGIGGFGLALLITFLLWGTINTAAAQQTEDTVWVFWVFDEESIFQDDECPTFQSLSGGDMCYVSDGQVNRLGLFVYYDHCNCWMPSQFGTDHPWAPPGELGHWFADGVLYPGIFAGEFNAGNPPNAWDIVGDPWCLHLNCESSGVGIQ